VDKYNTLEYSWVKAITVSVRLWISLCALINTNTSAEARDLEEDLAGVEASVGDLIGAEETGLMAGKTWDFGLR
jgi:hypothetical protein